MGDPSYLRFVPSSSATIPIDWAKVPEASKEFLLKGYGINFEMETDTQSDLSSEESHPRRFKGCPLPETIGELAKMFDERKFFGYMTPELCTPLLDISEFGLVKPRPTETVGLPVGPRFYMKYLYEIWFILFVPGCRDGIVGYSPEIPGTDDLYEEEDSCEEEYSYKEEGIAREKALAEDYDAKLCEEVSRMGTAGVGEAWQKVAGWEVSTLKRRALLR